MLYLLHSHVASSQRLLDPLLLLMLDAYPLQVVWLVHPMLYPSLENISNVPLDFVNFL